jgi:hypothetical protein
MKFSMILIPSSLNTMNRKRNPITRRETAPPRKIKILDLRNLLFLRSQSTQKNKKAGMIKKFFTPEKKMIRKRNGKIRKTEYFLKFFNAYRKA